MNDSMASRIALAHRINRLEFDEYRPCGWFKVAPLAELRSDYDPLERAIVERYATAPSEPWLDHAMVHCFLSRWLVARHPENLGAFGLPAEEFRAARRDEALASVDEVIAATLMDPDARIQGCLSWLSPAAPGEAEDVPYPQLRIWFAELFGHESRFYLHDTGHQGARLDPREPRVVGMAADLVGMLWLE